MSAIAARRTIRRLTTWRGSFFRASRGASALLPRSHLCQDRHLSGRRCRTARGWQIASTLGRPSDAQTKRLHPPTVHVARAYDTGDLSKYLCALTMTSLVARHRFGRRCAIYQRATCFPHYRTDSRIQVSHQSDVIRGTLQLHLTSYQRLARRATAIFAPRPSPRGWMFYRSLSRPSNRRLAPTLPTNAGSPQTE